MESDARQHPRTTPTEPEARTRRSFGRSFGLDLFRTSGLTAVLALSTPSAYPAVYEAGRVVPPPPSREFRGAWVATVGNIDWPSRKGLTSAEQQAELLAILNRAVQLKLNAIIFQVRPACDALYASRIEPWSEYLSGTMGQAPNPFYDPLTFVVAEAHKRGLELHAWFNPYRARGISDHPAAPAHISKTRPQLVRPYGKFLWLDPGERDVQDYSLSVIMDVVKRYDVDGVHFDDYFYPYKEKDAAGREIDFPDGASWRRFGVRSKLSRDDWRRDNVNRFIERVYRSIKAEKPWVKFGVSPFGIWRPGNPPQIKGFDSYAELYADSRKWLANGWLDYFAPQLYWAIEPPDQSFPVLLRWWAAQDTRGRHLFAGIDSTKTRSRWQPQEIVNQIRLCRSQPGADGHIHWNMRSLMRNGAFDEVLEREVYQQPAVMPASPWLGRSHPNKPRLFASFEAGGGLRLGWTSTGPGNAWLWLVQTQISDHWTTLVVPGVQTARAWTGAPPDVVAISAVDRNGNLSSPAVLQLQR